MIDCIILSVNENSNYIGAIPLSCQAHKKIFPDAKIEIGVLDTVPRKTRNQIKQYCDKVHVFSHIEKIPTCNQGKMMRHYIASKKGNKICMVNDADIIPINADYYRTLIKSRDKNKILATGMELYRKKKTKGKFRIAYMTCSGNTFKNIFEVEDNETWVHFMNRMINRKKAHYKEDLKRPLGVFSDESLIKEMRKNKGLLLDRRKLGYKTHIDCISRKTKFSHKKLLRGGYFEAHHLIPIEKYKNILQKIADYIGVKKWRIEC